MAMELDSAAAPFAESRSSAARSCITCSKAKAKCVRQSGQQICERCARLKKECFSKEPVLRRRKIIKPTRTAQLEKLESKIEHLVNALSASQQQRAAGYAQDSSPGSQSDHGYRGSEVLNALCDDRSSDKTTASVEDSTVSPIADSSQLPTLSQTTSPSNQMEYSSLMVSMREAEILLDRWRRLMAPGLPFVVVPSEVTAQQLYEQKPFLLHAITTVTYFHDLPKQQAMVKHLMRDLAERVLMNSEKNIGIVQGILVLVAWYHPHVFWGQQVTNLLHLGIAMTIDMGIDRLPQQCHDFKSATAKVVHGPSTMNRVPPSDELRTLAGVFYLTSMLASSFKKIDAMSYSTYLESCLDSLEQAREYESDLFLVQMVKIQHLIEDTHTVETPTAPMPMYVKAFEADLARLRAGDPCKDAGNVYLQMQYLTAEILVWELSLKDLQDNKAIPLRSHLDDLYRCLEAIKAFIDVYLSIPTSAYLTVPFSAYGQFAHAFIVLTKLASMEMDGWDMKRYSLNFSQIIEEAAVRFDAATKSTPDGLTVDNDSFAKWAQRVRWMKQVYEAKFVHDMSETRCHRDCDMHERAVAVRALFKGPAESDERATAAAGGGGVEARAQQQPTPLDDVLGGDYLNWLDENFWQSFSGDFDLGFTAEMAVT